MILPRKLFSSCESISSIKWYLWNFKSNLISMFSDKQQEKYKKKYSAVRIFIANLIYFSKFIYIIKLCFVTGKWFYFKCISKLFHSKLVLKFSLGFRCMVGYWCNLYETVRHIDTKKNIFFRLPFKTWPMKWKKTLLFYNLEKKSTHNWYICKMYFFHPYFFQIFWWP